MKRAVLLLLLAACAPTRGTAFEKDRGEAWRAFAAGRFAESAQKYEQAAKDAKVARDADFMRYEAGVAWLRAGDQPRAEAVFTEITKTDNAYSAQAALKLTEIAKTDDEKYAGLERLCIKWPEDGTAIVAALRIAKHDDESGLEKTIAHLEKLAQQTKGHKVEETFTWERAKRIEALGRLQEARDAYVAIADKWQFPFGAYFDDSLYRAALLDEKLGHDQLAITHVLRLLDTHETSTFLGTYERPKYVPALLALASIYEDKLHDREKARAALHRLYTEFPHSPFRDDALWREATLYQADGDAKSSCDRLKTLTRDYPDSRYVPCAVKKCPGLERPSKSKAPQACHAYIERGQGPSEPEHAEQPSLPLPEVSQIKDAGAAP